MARKWSTRDMPSLAGKVAVVTGANRGLGLEIAAALVQAGAHVVMAVRNESSGASGVTALGARVPTGSVEWMSLDLADLGSTRSFAETVSRRFDRLDLLINNASAILVPYGRTRDGFEMHMGVNQFGTFALTGLLLDRLVGTSGSRIVNTSSTAHRLVKGIDFDDLDFARGDYQPMEAYGRSKLATLLFTFELDRRLRRGGFDTKAVAAHPGYSNTNPDKGGFLLRLATSLVAQPPSMGILPTLFAATAPNVAGGDYIGPAGLAELRGYPKKVGVKPTALDQASAARLWEVSAERTGIRYLDTQPPR